jgi:ABC-2 type transport system ATP-binding protein
MIEIKNVVKSFDDFHALDGVSMKVKKGTVYGLVGPNGAGKTTILQCLTGVYRPDSGIITVDGSPVYENPQVKERIAYIPDELYHFPQANTLDMMKYYKGIYKNFDEERFRKMKEVFPAVDVKRPIRKLSKGMKKQVSFWLSICCRPDLIILDEPVDGLDPVMRHQIWSLMLSDVALNNTTVLVSSHNLRELEDVCSYVGIMNHGKIISQQSMEEIEQNRGAMSLEDYFIQMVGGDGYEVKDILG